MLPQVASYIGQCDRPHQEVLLFLRNLILESANGVVEKWRYKIPFYDYFGMAFYLVCKKDFVEMGFCNGHQLADESRLLVSQHLKIVRHYRVKRVSEIREAALKALIQESLMVRREHRRLNKNSSRTKKS